MVGGLASFKARTPAGIDLRLTMRPYSAGEVEALGFLSPKQKPRKSPEPAIEDTSAESIEALAKTLGKEGEGNEDMEPNPVQFFLELRNPRLDEHVKAELSYINAIGVERISIVETRNGQQKESEVALKGTNVLIAFRDYLREAGLSVNLIKKLLEACKEVEKGVYEDWLKELKTNFEQFSKHN